MLAVSVTAPLRGSCPPRSKIYFSAPCNKICKHFGATMRGARTMEDPMTLGTRTSQTVRPKVRLLDQVRETIRRKHYSLRTEATYIDWIKRYIFFHRKRQPQEMRSRGSGLRFAIWSTA